MFTCNPSGSGGSEWSHHSVRLPWSTPGDSSEPPRWALAPCSALGVCIWHVRVVSRHSHTHGAHLERGEASPPPKSL